MDRIYGNSSVTICAAGGDSKFGIPGALQKSRDLNQIVERCGNLELLAVRRVESYIQRSLWNTRAWTFQERLLSNRCLIFVDDRVFFQCRQATWSEELDGECTSLTWTLDMIGSPLTVFKENPLRRFSTCVKLYSGRKLTFYTDKLAAFEGLGKVLSSHLDAALHYGLPDSYFDWALLWELNMLPENIGTAALPDFPSWSWCGWNAGVEWRFSTTSGTLINLHEWLTDHTWIIWYKGQHHGYELVWKSPRIPQNPLRWDGYPKFASEEPYGRSPNTEIARQVATLEKSPTIAPREGCLHFWTYSAYFSLSTNIMSPEAFRIQLSPGLQQFAIHDSRGDFCGTIVLDELSISSNSPDPDETANFEDRVYEFIAISEAKDFELNEFDSWTYYIPQEREQAEWYLYYALLVRWNNEKNFYERVGLAKIFKAAFHSGSLEPGFAWKEIILG